MVARYRNLPMPNLGLSRSEVASVITYLREQDDARAQPARQ
jgi:hypothetical protein